MKLINASVRLYQLLLRLYPKATRTRVAEDMEECFRDLCMAAHRKQGTVGVIGAAFRTFAELPLSAWRAHSAVRKEMKTRGRGRLWFWTFVTRCADY